jgi:hypothetical protein
MDQIKEMLCPEALGNITALQLGAMNGSVLTNFMSVATLQSITTLTARHDYMSSLRQSDCNLSHPY